MSWLRIRNWDTWQTYRRDRGQPPWIKIHRALMRDDNWVELNDAERGQLVAMWMLAADKNGVIPASPLQIRKLTFMENEPDLQVFIAKGFIEPDILDAIPAPRRRQADASVTHQSRGEERRVEESGDDAKASSSPAGKTYAFTGKFVKGVDETDFSGWLQAFPTFSRESLLADLERCDQFYSGKGYMGKPPKNWFVTASSWIERTHKRTLEGRQTKKTPEQIAALRGVI